MLARVAYQHEGADLFDHFVLVDIFAGADVGGQGVFLMEAEAGGVEAQYGVEGGHGCLHVLSDGQSAAAVKGVFRIIAEHFDTQGDLVPGGGVYARHGEGGEDPDLVVVDEEVGAGAPVLGVTVEADEALHMRRGEAVRAIGQGGYGGIMQDDEGWPPGGPLEGVAIGVKGIGGEGEAYDRFPVRHMMLI